MKELHLFAGVGGGILGGIALGHTPVGAVEIEPYCQDILRQRQADGILPSFPIFGDIKQFNGYEFKAKYGKPDIIAGGFPCQDISSAGRGAGIDGGRSGLWSEMARIIREVRPDYVLVENSPLLVGRGLSRVLADLATMRYNAVWRIIGADDVGAPHVRKRIWILARRQEIADFNIVGCGEEARQGISAISKERVSCPAKFTDRNKHAADTASLGLEAWSQPRRHAEAVTELADTPCERCHKVEQPHSRGAYCSGASSEAMQSPIDPRAPGWWLTEPDVVRMVYGVPRRVDRIRALGNAQVPAVAAFAFAHLMNMYNQLEVR